MCGPNKYSSPRPSSSSSSWPHHVDVHKHKEKVTADGAVLSFVFRDELSATVDPFWDVNLEAVHSYPTIEEAERGLEKALESLGNGNPFTDITNYAQHAESPQSQEATGPKQAPIPLAEDSIPLVTRTSSCASVGEIRNVSCTTQAVSVKGNEKEGTITNEIERSETGDMDSLGPEEARFMIPSTSAMPYPIEMQNTAADEKDQQSTQSGVVGPVTVGKGKRRAFHDDDKEPVAPRKRKRADQHQVGHTSEQVSKLQNVPERNEGGHATGHGGPNNKKTRDRLADNFIFWRFGFKYVYDVMVRWSCPFSAEYALEHQTCQAQFDANVIEKHISEHIKSFEEKHKGEPLGCPLGGQDECQWDNKDRTENAVGPNYGLPRHIRQVHLGTRRVECLCGSILSRDTRQELVRHLRLASHSDGLNRKRINDPSIPFYPAVNDPSLSEEERAWKNLYSTSHGKAHSSDDKGEGSSKGVKRRRSE